MIEKNPVKAIRAKCLDCCNDNQNEVKMCNITSCPLHEFRFGKNPYRAKPQYSEEQKEIMRTRLANIRRQKQGENQN